MDGERYENIGHPGRYIDAVESGRTAVVRAYRPDANTAMFDWLSLALRLVDGFSPDAFRERFHRDVEEVVGETLAGCERAGLIERTGDRVRLTRRGRMLHGEVSVRLLMQLDARGVSPLVAGSGGP
jgi:oxygen-independent coproporphyrinogen-3 oxidase